MKLVNGTEGIKCEESRLSVCANQRLTLTATEMFDVSLASIECECAGEWACECEVLSTSNHVSSHSLIASRCRTSVSAPLKLSLSQPITAQLSTQQSNSCSTDSSFSSLFLPFVEEESVRLEDRTILRFSDNEIKPRLFFTDDQRLLDKRVETFNS